jgi:cytochrome d ubiquinol oxidase subunit II
VDLHTLRIIWFGLIAVLWVGYLVLEGFDFGVGMLLPVLGRNDTERRVLINTIGPVWDGNEVWLLTAGGATFAAFPLWYATLFSAFYLPLLLVLVAIIIRGVAFEYRGKIDDATWRARWDWAIVIGSALPSLLWGVAFGNIVAGVDIDTVKAGPFHVLLAALNPYALLGGLTTLSLFLLHGALFLGLRTTDDLRARAVALAGRLAIPTLGIAGAWAIWTQLAYGKGWTWIPVALAAAALIGVVLAARAGREGVGFVLTSAVTVLAVVIIFGSLFPDVLPIHGADSLTIDNASSTLNTLTVMTWVAVIMTPIVLAYQAWAYWVFRRRLGLGDIPASAGLTASPADA